MTIRSGEFAFEPVTDWLQSADEVPLVEAIGVAVDSQDRVYIFNRGVPALIVLDQTGRLIRTWHDGRIVRPHGIWIAPDDTLYLVDDMGHRVMRFSAEGQHISTFGPVGAASPSGADGFDHRTITHGVGPYNLPTNAVTSSTGELFVADGYGNSRIHHFNSSGQLLKSWGEPGSGRAEFCVPHGLGIDDSDRLYVADRENSRIQIFDASGELLSIWTDVIRPCEVFIRNDLAYVAELGLRNGLFPWMEKSDDAVGSRVSIFDLEGNLKCRWGGGKDARRADEFCAAHDIWVDSRGDIYVGEVAVTASTLAGNDATGLPTLRKFARTD